MRRFRILILCTCRLIPETKGKSLEEMDIIFGAVDPEQRKRDIEKVERAFDQGEDNSVRSDVEKA